MHKNGIKVWQYRMINECLINMCVAIDNESVVIPGLKEHDTIQASAKNGKGM